MAEDTSQEKTEEPTSRKLEKSALRKWDFRSSVKPFTT